MVSHLNIIQLAGGLFGLAGQMFVFLEARGHATHGHGDGDVIQATSQGAQFGEFQSAVLAGQVKGKVAAGVAMAVAEFGPGLSFDPFDGSKHGVPFGPGAELADGGLLALIASQCGADFAEEFV